MALEDLVRRHSGAYDALDAPFKVHDFIQMACCGLYSVVIQVERSGELMGTLTVYKGELWAARDVQGVGQSALRRLAFDESVRCRVVALDGPPGPRLIEARWQVALMEAARVRDEQSRRSSLPPTTYASQPPAESFASEPPPSVRGDSLEELLDEALALMLTQQREAAYQVYLRAQKLAPEHRTIDTNLRRLRALLKKEG